MQIPVYDVKGGRENAGKSSEDLDPRTYTVSKPRTDEKARFHRTFKAEKQKRRPVL